MDINGFARMVADQLPFRPTDQQMKLVDALARFCSAYTPQDTVFVLNGYAGTGKTSVMGALVRSLNTIGIPTVLLASTGRAAKVLQNFTGLPAYTIHRKIYHAPSASDIAAGISRVNENTHINTVFIVDEASMIGGADSASQSLLADLIMYVYSGVNCRLILLGDTAQLPPVGLAGSPAMDPVALKELGMRVTRAVMTRTVRQKSRSGILFNATALRRALKSGKLSEPSLVVTPFADVDIVSPEELEDALTRSFSQYGADETLLITRSNRRAADFNMAIRRIVYDREEMLVKGERLIVAKNNYYWTRRSVIEADAPGAMPPRTMEFIANGETAEVVCIYSTEQRSGMLFAEVRLRFPDFDSEVNAKICLDALISDAAALPPEKMQALADMALADAGISADTASPTAVKKALRESPYFNALQVKYGYAVTCHKAQGGQWRSVFVDMGYIPPEAYTSEEFYRWLYTAITRATAHLTFINPSVQVT